MAAMAAALEQPTDGTNGAIVLNATFEFELPQALSSPVASSTAAIDSVFIGLPCGRLGGPLRRILGVRPALAPCVQTGRRTVTRAPFQAERPSSMWPS